MDLGILLFTLACHLLFHLAMLLLLALVILHSSPPEFV
jgi:hypothetical protein